MPENASATRPPHDPQATSPGNKIWTKSVQVGRTCCETVVRLAKRERTALSVAATVALETSAVERRRRLWCGAHPKGFDFYRCAEHITKEFGVIGGGYASDVRQSTGWLRLPRHIERCEGILHELDAGLDLPGTGRH